MLSSRAAQAKLTASLLPFSFQPQLRTFWDREARTGLGEYDAVDITDKKRWFVLNDILLLLRESGVVDLSMPLPPRHAR